MLCEIAHFPRRRSDLQPALRRSRACRKMLRRVERAVARPIIERGPRSMAGVAARPIIERDLRRVAGVAVRDSFDPSGT